MTPEERLERYARLAVEVGSNVGEGQVVWVIALPEHAPLARAVARVAYENGATLRRRRLHRPARPPRADRARRGRHARLDPAVGAGQRSTTSPSERGALIQIVGDPEPELLADLDGTRVGKTRMRELAERYVKALNERLINWTIVAYPNEGWATTVFGEPDVETALGRRRVGDPPRRAGPGRGLARPHRQAGRARRAPERARVRQPPLPRAGHRPHRRPDSRRARGARRSRRRSTAAGTWSNMPTEEVFTSPDRRRTEGVVRSTKPLALVRQRRPRPRAPLRGRPRRRGERELRRRADPRADAPGRVRLHARRGRPRRRRLARRPLRPHVPEHALRRERELPHRLRRRHPRRDRGRRPPRARPSSRSSASTPRRSTPTS